MRRAIGALRRTSGDCPRCWSAISAARSGTQQPAQGDCLLSDPGTAGAVSSGGESVRPVGLHVVEYLERRRTDDVRAGEDNAFGSFPNIGSRPYRGDHRRSGRARERLGDEQVYP